MKIKEALQKNREKIQKNIITFNLFGETVEQYICWNNLSMMVVDELYEGDFEEFTNVLDKIRELSEKNEKAIKTHSLGIPGIVKANLAIVWGLLAGAGEVLEYEDMQQIAYEISRNEEALQTCWKTMIKANIEEDDLKKIQIKEEASTALEGVSKKK